MEEDVTDQTNIIVDVRVGVNVKVAVKSELKPDLNEGVIEPVHFLIIVKKMETEGVDEFIPFSFTEGGKVQATRASCDIGVRMREVIIP
ncbi:hypothetical protein J1N35_000976 [Gossypium stocksii]|uniref:Uncharacterized protein n=1 Tax=Gossypium stocksii TaxID=47602 RepID=A0A9D3WJK7_9ROSI|nr:hypothetical protein J1N35_000976 [Gossypium stocksii]